VLAAEDLPEGASRVVYVDGDQVAVFNAGGDVYALGNRCSHANGPLADGVVEGGCVTCPWHGSRFELATGKPQEGPAAKPVPTYRVKVENGGIFIAGGETLARA
jgi:nitrite reductase/ring-hydroxylating ferredoxin subunit